MTKDQRDKAEAFMLKCEFLGDLYWTEQTHDRFLEFLDQSYSELKKDHNRKFNEGLGQFMTNYFKENKLIITTAEEQFPT